MKKQAVNRIRQFNRFYLPKFDLLGNSYLESELTVTEARVLYEIFTNDGCTAADIAKTLNLDKSYLSRIIRSHEKSGYLSRVPSPQDSRAYELHLTQKGTQRSKDFIDRANEHILKKISALSDTDCERLIAAFDTVTEILEGKK